jgi:peroxiredoxin
MRLQPGDPAPEFSLPDFNGRTYTLGDFADAKALLVMAVCNHCPFVKHVAEGIRDLARDFMPKGVAIVGINSNDIKTHPEDSPKKMKQAAAEWGWDFPYLFDESQDVAKAYGAACTPDFFLFDSKQKLAYRGQLDDSRPGNEIPVTCKDLRAAIDSVLAGKPVKGEQKPSIGCNIKWKPGNEPEYFGLNAKRSG